MIRREAGTENSLVKNMQDQESFLCLSSANQLKEALWSCVMRILEDRSGR